mmetsp:Transcript_24933/g.41078  ORF Transcript_24933/g.41078 Transcript_24933/m.41078 type:complete len:264 (+) Transcript_24933:147-938(+)
MNVAEIDRSLQRATAAGQILSTAERVAMSNAMLLLWKNKRVHNFAKVVFWGKICTSGKCDYLIMQCFDEKLHLARKKLSQNLYSKDNGVTFSLLPDIDSFFAKKAGEVQVAFTGDPSYLYNTSGGQKISEEQRLSAVINAIDKDCWIVPRGCLTFTSHFEAVANPTWEGISGDGVFDLRNWVHIRHIPSINKMNPLDSNFLQSITDDDITDCWTSRYDPVKSSMIVSNWIWPGFKFFYKTGSKQFGRTYMGDGCRNVDFQFMA